MPRRNYKLHRERLNIPVATRLISAADAARIIEQVHKSTVHRWVKKGWTSFGMSLDVVVRSHRPLIPQFKAHAVKEFLQDHPLPHPGASHAEREEFRRAAILNCTFFPRSAYSRARQPKLKTLQF